MFQSMMVKEAQITPFLPNVATGAPAVIEGGKGEYLSGQLLGHQYHYLRLDQATVASDINVGAIYCWSARADDDQPVSSHWLYAITGQPAPTFGVTRDWSRSGKAAPILASPVDGLIKLEALHDFVAVLSPPDSSFAHFQAQMGNAGWLVMSSMTVPFSVGVLIEAATPPTQFAEGVGGITIRAQSERTFQSIEIPGLTCARIGANALFLRPVQN